MTVTIKKLSAGAGYDYLIKQVAMGDATSLTRGDLATYYSEHGETPGRWVGSGLASLEGLEPGDLVTADHIEALFGAGLNPRAAELVAALGPDATGAEREAVARLGRPYRLAVAEAPKFQVEVKRRMEKWNTAHGLKARDEAPADVQAAIRTDVGRELFIEEFGRAPIDARELSSAVARYSRPGPGGVGGFDLTFSPVKSVSALWAVADPATAAAIERAHNEAVTDALTYLEEHALYAREGTDGAKQVDVTGLLGTQFTHRDSRAGDPDLHTHVAVANKVCARRSRKWLSIDGRNIFKAIVSVSEAYNTALEKHLEHDLGVQFVKRLDTDPRKRPIREVVGVDPALNAQWSKRREDINARRAELATRFQRKHGRAPTPLEAIRLAQQANTETRAAKHDGRTTAELRDMWRHEAIDTLGSAAAVDAMVTAALHPRPVAAETVTSAWVRETATAIIGRIKHDRATWSEHHVRAEAQRRVRGTTVTADQIDTVVSLLVDEALNQSVVQSDDSDSIDEPAELRRDDGTSVFHVAGSTIYTSADILAAEQRIVTAAGERTGRVVAGADVDLALAESAAARGIELNAGQATLVRAMATSGARVQLGIAAAGTGKTAAMSALTRAWEESGGNVVGLAPSANAAAQLREHTGATTDTLAKLITELGSDHTELIDRIGPATLMLVDEAGMAGTEDLDKAISFARTRGASVRLIGDDQQLAAVQAGGVLRDIAHAHGALRLADLMRFDDPAEGAATLALRDGLPEALGYYLDHQRTHVGDLATLTEDVFQAWQSDRNEGYDSIMLAPTLDLVSELNARAREARIADRSALPRAEVHLADGNRASVGETVITRKNDRRLRLSATDWVKNGDRWAVTAIRGGALQVKHLRSGLTVTLPPAYVTDHTELGYASTIHTAQGVSVDRTRGLITGDETREQFYTLMTRGRQENHVYLEIGGDGDAHSVVTDEALRPLTPTEKLEAVLARVGASMSSTTVGREADASARQLTIAAGRYVSAVYTGAEKLIGSERVTHLEAVCEQLAPGIGDEPAWPALRAHLILRDANGHDAARDLTVAIAERELDGVDDRAAVLDWRLDPTGMRGAKTGPLPWMPAIPAALADDPVWGPYLSKRAERVRDFADIVHSQATDVDVPAWLEHSGLQPDTALLGDIAVWRSANGVAGTDRRPTGRPQHQKAAAGHQRQLDDRLAAGRTPALAEWGPLLDEIHPRRDRFTAILAERLDTIARSGVNAAALLRQAAAEGELPDDHIAAALWWRIRAHLSPTVATKATTWDLHVESPWSERLVDAIGASRAGAIEASRYWPELVSSLDHALTRGWTIPQLLEPFLVDDLVDVDPAQAAIWKLTLLTDAPEYDDEPFPPEVEDWAPQPEPDVLTLDAVAAERDALPVLERVETTIPAGQHDPGIPVARLYAANEAACEFYERRFDGSWAELHFTERFNTSLAGDPRFRPGYAPAGWTHLVNHLRERGFTDAELLAAGLAKTAKTGNLIDRFRHRAVLPILVDGQVLGFIGRRHPEENDDTAGPKYLNTPATDIFTKGHQLYGLADEHMAHGAIPVLVEGPMDAIAVTLATAGAHVGVAPLGTALTDDQAHQLAELGRDPIVATDGDLGGRIAADRDYWLLTRYGLHPRLARFGADTDPASLYTGGGPTPLRAALFEAGPLTASLIDTRIEALEDAIIAAARVAAAAPTDTWSGHVAELADRLHLTPAAVERYLGTAAATFNQDRRRFTDSELGQVSDLRRLLEQQATAAPTERWAALARRTDPRLVDQPDWPATAAMLEEIARSGADVGHLMAAEIAKERLGNRPATDLRYRLVGHLPESARAQAPAPEETPRTRSTPTEPTSTRIGPDAPRM